MSYQSSEAKACIDEQYETLISNNKRREFLGARKAFPKAKKILPLDADFYHLRNNMRQRRIPRAKLYQKSDDNGDKEYLLLQKEELALLARCTLVYLHKSNMVPEQKRVWERSLKWSILSRINVGEAERGEKEIFIAYKDIRFGAGF